MTNRNDRQGAGSDKRKVRARRFGIDHASHRLMLGAFSIGMPRSRVGRMTIGVALVLCGFLGFLPILGFWMLPLGLLVLSHDLPIARRLRRRLAVWWHRRRRPAG
ncbi:MULTISPECIES: membrane protein [Rhizobium]|uniref:Hypothetical conserved protein n=1 Tax=Rhizobium etli (strain CIAT 652) TaxID=491916 RepID=B3PXS3_RHIE6|nr:MULTISPECIES: membrane protein [Rhizobium]ACE90859.1 hypothetical conserved protein [Rhizobium etli CIAT 652]KKZ89359.1 hypothetical protein RPHASCH2410_CH01815 [Rhizobium phaseoli Ch24-10]MDE8761340.1 hypothetical protein [Rhizobium sp. CBK13]MDK4727947.1 hypothetical protein [Rhizobium phaseoli]NKE87836.1 hypothetical protein [Rhizobium phaseoli]